MAQPQPQPQPQPQAQSESFNVPPTQDVVGELRRSDAQTLYGDGVIPTIAHIDNMYSRYRAGTCRDAWQSYRAHIRYMDPRPIQANLQTLEANARRMGLSEEYLKKTLATFLKNQNELGDQRYISVVDFDKNADGKRMYVIDLKSGGIESYKVSNSQESDRNHDGWADRFSNRPGSNESSVGCYVAAGKTWHHGTALRLHGMSATNDNACGRALLLHPASYVTYGQTGRSLGCLAMTPRDARKVVPELNSGGLICAYSKGVREHNTPERVYQARQTRRPAHHVVHHYVRHYVHQYVHHYVPRRIRHRYVRRYVRPRYIPTRYYTSYYVNHRYRDYYARRYAYGGY